MNERLAAAVEMTNKGELEKARGMLLQLVSAHPDCAEAHYHCGAVHDALGLEKEAAPFYERAIVLGLNERDLPDVYACLGSTYRVLGEYEKSLRILETGKTQFPNYRPISVFLALTLYHLNRYEEAMELVLKQLVDTTNDEGLRRYKRALAYYANHLDMKPD